MVSRKFPKLCIISLSEKMTFPDVWLPVDGCFYSWKSKGKGTISFNSWPYIEYVYNDFDLQPWRLFTSLIWFMVLYLHPWIQSLHIGLLYQLLFPSMSEICHAVEAFYQQVHFKRYLMPAVTLFQLSICFLLRYPAMLTVSRLIEFYNTQSFFSRYTDSILGS